MKKSGWALRSILSVKNEPDNYIYLANKDGVLVFDTEGEARTFLFNCEQGIFSEFEVVKYKAS